MIDYDSLEEFQDPETYDLICDAFNDDMPTIEQWAHKLGGPLLDLACGTGRMSIHLALQGYQVTGVDIVSAMIERARQKAAVRSAEVEFVVSDARSFHLNREFPFIFMLMNAFQFLPMRTDHEAILACVREHLQPDGYFLFETRNPTPRNLEIVRQPEGERATKPDGTQVLLTQAQHYDPITQIQHYTSVTTFQHPDGQVEKRSHRTALRYVFPQEMEALLHYNGFQIHTVYGDWQQNPLTASSPAMIYVCQKRA